MTPEKAAKQASNNLIQAFKALRPRDEVVDFDILEHHSYRRAPSDRQFLLDHDCMDAIHKAARKLYGAIGTYPREKAHEAITDVVISIRDQETPVEKAHEELTRGVLEWLNHISDLGDWEVIHAVRGVQTYDQPFTIGHCQFFQMDEDTFRLWGQRFATGQYEPPPDAPILRSWVEQDGSLLRQAVALASVRACDSDHASADGRRIINESLDLLRYGQVTYGWPPEPVPEFGLAALSAHGYVQTQTICVRRDKPAMSTNKSIGAGDGAAFEYCKGAPAWESIERVLLVDPNSRSEMQRRIMLALEWVGQAALASSLPVRLVAFTTALETLLIEDSEALGKKAKLSARVAAFPKMEQANRHIDSTAVETLYGLRSGCLHAGRTDIEVSDVQVASMAVAQCFSGLLEHAQYSNCQTVVDLLAVLTPATESA